MGNGRFRSLNSIASKSINFDRLLRRGKGSGRHHGRMTTVRARPLHFSPALLTKATLVLLVLLLECADVVTTNRALTHPGVWEGNPLMAWCMDCLGAFWWAPLKLGFVAYMLATLPLIRRTWPLALVAGLFAVLVVNNLTYW
jgi:Domain of unknown function (DUF5658)